MGRRVLRVTPPRTVDLANVERFVTELNAQLDAVSSALDATAVDTSAFVTRSDLIARGLYPSVGGSLDIGQPLIARAGLLIGESEAGVTSSSPRTVGQIALEEAERLFNSMVTTGIDADTLDGLDSTAFALVSHSHAPGDISPQGSGSGLDADLLDGMNATAFASVSHAHDAGDITSGALAVARGGTGAATASANTVFAGPTSGGAAAPAFRALVHDDIDELIALADLTDVSATTGSGTTAVLATSPTFVTSITTPLIYGGTGTTDDLDLRASSASNYTSTVHVGRGSLTIGDTTVRGLTLFADGVTKNFSSTYLRGIDMTGTVVCSTGIGGQVNLFSDTGVYQGPSSGAFGFPVNFTIFANATIQPGANSQTSLGSKGVFYTPTIAANGFTGHTLSSAYAVGTAGSVAANCTVTTWGGLTFAQPTNSGTLGTLVAVDVAALTAATTNLSLRSVGTSVEQRHAGPAMFGATGGPDTTAGAIVHVSRVHTLTAGINDGYAAAIRLDPGYTAAFTVVRHNYIDVQDVSLAASAAVTDACVMRFDAAAGTHKAVAAGTTKTTPGTVNAWIKHNINGTIYYVPAYTSTTS